MPNTESTYLRVAWPPQLEAALQKLRSKGPGFWIAIPEDVDGTSDEFITWGPLKGIADIRAQEALTQFEASVLQALEETDNALTDYGNIIQRRAALQSNRDAVGRAAMLAQQRFREGAASFLDVLDAERSSLAAQDAYAQALQVSAVALVRVYAAVGGAWESMPAAAERPQAMR